MKVIKRTLNYDDGRTVPVMRQVDDDYEISALGGRENDIPYTEEEYTPNYPQQYADMDAENQRLSRQTEQLIAASPDPDRYGPAMRKIYNANVRNRRAALGSEEAEYESLGLPEQDQIARAREISAIRNEDRQRGLAEKEIAYRRFMGYEISPEEEAEIINANKEYGRRVGMKMALPGGTARAATVLPIEPGETPQERLARKGRERQALMNHPAEIKYLEGRSPQLRNDPRAYSEGKFLKQYQPTNSRSYRMTDFFSPSQSGEQVFNEEKFLGTVPNAERTIGQFYRLGADNRTPEFDREAFMQSVYNPYRPGAVAARPEARPAPEPELNEEQFNAALEAMEPQEYKPRFSFPELDTKREKIIRDIQAVEHIINTGQLPVLDSRDFSPEQKAALTRETITGYRDELARLKIELQELENLYKERLART
jgi:hypothetical protein